MKNISFGQSNDAPPRSGVPAVAKAVRVLEAVAADGSGLGVSEIARRAGLSKSTAHGLAAALVVEGLLAHAAGKGYRLGPKLIELAGQARDQRLLDVAAEELQRLAHDTGETALFGRLHGDRVVILARQESQRTLNLSAPVGSSVPLLAGALGKAYLASIGRPAAAAWLEARSLPRYTERSITDPATYRQQVESAQERGYATERGEYLPGVAAAATAFLWLDATYFVWAIGIEAGHGQTRLDEIGLAVRRAAGAVLAGLDDDRRDAG